MLYNSHLFIFGFLPVVWAGFWLLSARRQHRAALGWLLVASLTYYGWDSPRHLALLGASILVNYALGRILGRHRRHRGWLTLGLALNLGALAWFKYLGFLVENLDRLAGLDARVGAIVLPLGISFFTFQQISYLVDVFRGEPCEPSLLRYAVYVSFFPQLIAGPVVQERELDPQLLVPARTDRLGEYVAAGFSLFLLGLFKKVVLADGVAAYATPVFDAADRGAVVTFFEAWGGVLSYAFQIYFDFSGYSDMALGLGYLFGYRLPLNFDVPYRATGIIDFWRRWHLTLSRFLREYLYVPLGGNRHGRARRWLNLLLTMTLGGLWHGAGWNFAIWGGLHGLMLVVNTAWRGWRRGWRRGPAGRLEREAGALLTFVAVVLAWNFFRADTLAGALTMLRGCLGLNGAVLDGRLRGTLGFLSPLVTFGDAHAGTFSLHGAPWLLALAAVCRWLPDPPRLFAGTGLVLDPTTHRTWQPTPSRWPQWQPSARWAAALAVLGAVAVVQMSRVMEFIYYRF